MRRFFLMMILIGMVGLVQAQKNDYIWLAGYDSWAPDTFNGFRFGNTRLDFNHSPVAVSFDSLQMNFAATNVSYCDSSGNLLFYSNGVAVANALNEILENGDSLNAGWAQYDFNPATQTQGYPYIQGIMALPDVGNSNHYYLVHSLADSIPGSNGTKAYISKILSTYIDMSANAGHGKVIYKNKPILTGSFEQDLTACKHGNGRDWWLLIQKSTTNCFYQVLLDSSGFNVVDSICLGAPTGQGQLGASCFSPDGSKFVNLTSSSGLSIYDFDRCTGTLSNALNLPMPILLDSALYIMGTAISPNSRFLYVCIVKHIYQFDLQSNDIFGNIDTIANWEGWYTSGTAEFFNNPQLAPDGKIYVTCGRTPFFNVINNPDLKSSLCSFTPHSDSLSTIVAGVPNFPNYRLVALTKSQCDSLTTFTQDVRDAKEKILKVFPNPAIDATNVDYGFTDWNKGPVSLEVTNQLGQIIYAQSLPMYSAFQRLNISTFAAGMYNVTIKRNAATVAVAKLVKE